MLGEMAVNAVVAGIEFPADEPFPERGIRSVERFAPGLVPIEQLGVDVETFWEVFFAEFFDERGIGEIGLRFEFLRRVEILLFFPMHRNLRFRQLVFRRLRVCFLASFGHGENSPSKIDFGCDATTRDSLIRASAFPQSDVLARKNDAPTRARESIRAVP